MYTSTEGHRFVELTLAPSGQVTLVCMDFITAFGPLGPEVAGCWIRFIGGSELQVKEDFFQIQKTMFRLK